MTSAPAVEDLLRELAPQVLGTLVRRYGDFGAAEDAVQEALLAAALHWPRDWLPDNPGGWLTRAAPRRLTDLHRSEQARRRREVAAARQEVADAEPVQHDDTLALLFLCCHPELAPASAVALTLRAVGGLTTAEIATAFLVSEATMAQRISRSKRRIKGSGLGFAMPAPDEFGPRLQSVLKVLYLIFNEGYTSSGVVGEYQSQAAIAALHSTAERAEDVDWPQILGLYGLLEQVTDNPVVALNRAVATAMVHGPAAGLEQLAPLAERLSGHHRLDAVRGHLYDMVGDRDAAASHYRAAAARTTSEPERRYLLMQAARLASR